MSSKDVIELLEEAQEKTGVIQVNVRHRPRLLSDNGPCYLSEDLKAFLRESGMEHVRGAPYHPQTQGKIERFHRSMKNIIKLDNYYYPWELEKHIAEFIEYYYNERYHEALNNVTPRDMYQGRYHEVETKRDKIKKLTLERISIVPYFLFIISFFHFQRFNQ